MNCILCDKVLIDGDSVAKIVRAMVSGAGQSLLYQTGGEEGVVHVDCLVDVTSNYNRSQPALHDSDIERNNILEFLER